MMDAATLAACTGAKIARAAIFLPHMVAAMGAYAIDTPARQSAFLAQVAHESGRLRYTAELWGPTAAQRGYEGRADLGNVQPGDGSKYRGHGLIQTTGRANHAAVRDRLRARFPAMLPPDFEEAPLMLTEPLWASYSACDFWDMKRLNEQADIGDFIRITRRINGGLNGYEDRLALWVGAKKALGA